MTMSRTQSEKEEDGNIQNEIKQRGQRRDDDYDKERTAVEIVPVVVSGLLLDVV